MNRPRGGGEDHKPASPFDHNRRCVITCDVAAAKPDIQHVADRQRLLPEVSWGCQLVMQSTRVVNEDVESSLLAAHRRKERSHLFIVTVIDSYRNALPAGRCHGRGRLVDGPRKRRIPRLFRSPGHIDRASVTAERDRNTATGPAAGAGDDDDRFLISGEHNSRSEIQSIVLPPSAPIVWPVMYLDSSLARKRASGPISSGVPK